MSSYRVPKIASAIRSIVSEALANKLNDPRISPLASVTKVEVSADLQHARVYISVIGQPNEAKRTLAGLTSATGQIQRIVARQLTMRRAPLIHFELDESLKKAAAMMRLIEETMAEYRDDDLNDPNAPVELPDDDQADEPSAEAGS